MRRGREVRAELCLCVIIDNMFFFCYFIFVQSSSCAYKMHVDAMIKKWFLSFYFYQSTTSTGSRSDFRISFGSNKLNFFKFLAIVLDFANSISNSYMDLFLVLGMRRRVKTAPATEVMALMKNTPLMPRLLTSTGKA